MRNRLRKIMICMIVIEVMASSKLVVEAADTRPCENQQMVDDANGAVICADSIVIKFRMYHGKQQYRRWNETRGKWVDPEWIDL